MTNEEWLESLAHNDIPALRAWFKAEHVETANVDELKGQVFTLKVECDDLTSTCDDLENELYKAKSERDNLEAKCDGWKKHAMAIENAYNEALRWRDEYRSKFGKCLDYADAIHALMDDEGLA